MKSWIIAALVAVIAVGATAGVFAGTRTVDRVVEVRFYERVDDPSENHLSIRARGGPWTLVEVPEPQGHARNGGYTYADFAVVLPVRVDAPDEPPMGTASSSGYWSVTRLYDAIYDEETVSATLSSEAVLDKVWTGSLVDNPYIQVYCRGDELQALIYWDKSIFAPVVHNPVPTIRSVPAVWRVDRDAPVEERWLPSTHGTATFPQYPSAFISDILGGRTLIMRVIPANGERHTVTFDISGLGDVIGNLTCFPR